jgi:hypothetical protein
MLRDQGARAQRFGPDVNDNQFSRLVAPDRSDEAFALAADLVVRYDDMALARARMNLYAALNGSNFVNLDLVAQVCFIIMGQIYHDTIKQMQDGESRLNGFTIVKL